MGIELSKMPKLGFGLMRLPEKDGEVDIQQVSQMVDKYLEAGLNYLDTAYIYHGGKSEVAAREALVKRHNRDEFMLATKLPAWEIKKAEDVERIFNEQLERTGVDFFDFYLLHSIEEGGNIDNYEKYDCFNWALKKKEEGKIKHFGFSFHGSPELLEEVLDGHPEVEFVQIQYNYLDRTNPVVRSQRLYDILVKRNIPIIVMEPVRGGMLAEMDPEIEASYKKMRPNDSIASWALRFVASQPGIMTVLSGMSNTEQMEDNLKTFTNFEPITDEELKLIDEATEKILSVPQIGCTACKYCCDGCPSKISIPDVFRSINTLRRYPDDWRSKNFYNVLTERSGKASDCIACGQCESVCPQHLPIIDLMKEAAEILDA
ncbi:aldo/keto reductase [Eubacterium xylanophilum]|uniref:aldo/keto reductase n=1 Tax=Eubacterium xylanophilum TaxID=39497 RepID=UPI0004B934C3|nr:aldo/keto reductase [Eubacterium xylanophilum]